MEDRVTSRAERWDAMKHSLQKFIDLRGKKSLEDWLYARRLGRKIDFYENVEIG